MERDPNDLNHWFHKLEAGWERESQANLSANNADATSINSSSLTPNPTACTASHELCRTTIEDLQHQLELMRSELRDTKKELEDAKIGWRNCYIEKEWLQGASSQSYSMVPAVEERRADAGSLFETHQRFSDNGQYSGIGSTATGQFPAWGQGQPKLGNDNTRMVRYY
ncbi:hypothetical protein L204_105144 [Cryptococcus depauperatus]|nr:hypothetical protein L204_03795 [Cryptococcus depauperatus CBS 7855]